MANLLWAIVVSQAGWNCVCAPTSPSSAAFAVRSKALLTAGFVL